ncbi:MAG: reverse transcriptase domain-containing protein [Patescibacteria group bacterium]
MQEFEFNLEDNIFNLYYELKNKTYKHSDYTSFFIKDPKLRHIHKATVKDRILHHAIFRILYLIFDKQFIYDSYSCRLKKGTHKAVNRLKRFLQRLIKNNIKTTFILKCDIKKFFDSVNQNILLGLINKNIKNTDIIQLVKEIIKSFETEKEKGIPLGNITSQLFANIYLNELDKFIKHKLKIKYYIRYCDDFIILDTDKNYLIGIISVINDFLKDNLNLYIHSQKVFIRKYIQGIDFLGYVVLPHYRVLRTKTKKRMLKKTKNQYKKLSDKLISEKQFNQSLQSYLGILKHCSGYKVKQKMIKNIETDK